MMLLLSILVSGSGKPMRFGVTFFFTTYIKLFLFFLQSLVKYYTLRFSNSPISEKILIVE